MNRKRHWGTWLALAFSLVMLGLTFGKVSLQPLHFAWRFDGRELWPLLSAHPLAFAGVALLEAVQLPLRAWLWRFMLPVNATRQSTRYHAVALGALAQNVLPARAGELVRGLSLAQSCPRLGKTRSLITVATAKLPELAALLTFIALAPLTVDVSGPSLAAFRKGAWIGAVALVLLLAVALLLGRARGRADRIEESLRHLPGALGRKLAHGVEELAQGAAACGTIARALAAYGVALVTVGASLAAFSLGLWAVGAPHGLGAATVVLGVVNVGMSLPSSPSGVGVFHFACLYALSALGADPARAAAFALATHLVTAATNIGCGLASLLRGHDSLRALSHAPLEAT